ncbi:MAG TPA: response regulator transcription factor [Oscillospiraceae bacterium]|nr:response regulator transcription factor [Oscillospiraceae bacterium]
MYKIMLIEDDNIICDEIASLLIRWGYEVRSVVDFTSVTAEFADFSPQLVLMDISLPFYNGYYWCSEIRKLSRTPIMFVSSSSDNINIVMAMNMGGDDFISKPFSPDVLAAKIQALLRRSYDFQPLSSLLEHKGAILNLSDTTLTVGQNKVELTKNEFRILQLLFEKKGCVVPREEIMKRLWNSDCFIDDNTLTVNMTRLRKKLEEAEAVDFISTKKGIGYLLDI